MKLFELLETARKTQDVIVNDEYVLGIKYNKELNCFVWCKQTGQDVIDENDITGFKRVILSPKLYSVDSWHLDVNKFK